jgi:hypothetical protein
LDFCSGFDSKGLGMLRGYGLDRRKERKGAFVIGGSVSDSWKRQEKRVAVAVGGKRTIRSGALPCIRGDVKNDNFLIECKSTDGAGIFVAKKWIEKISKEALGAKTGGKIPAIALDFGNTKIGIEKDWVLVPMSVFVECIKDNV